MAKSVWQKEFNELLPEISASGRKPRLLLHACCGPCSSSVLEMLVNFFDVTVLFYNPNIYPQAEYRRRLSELKDFYMKFPAVTENSVAFMEEEYVPQEFYEAAGISAEPELADEPERGERCRRCYEFRLERTYSRAVSGKFDYFCTTLSVSPYKDADKINSAGKTVAARNPSGPKWLPSDFKKNNGFLRSLQLSAEYGLYRQDYCGCVFSMKNSASGTEESLH